MPEDAPVPTAHSGLQSAARPLDLGALPGAIADAFPHWGAVRKHGNEPGARQILRVSHPSYDLLHSAQPNTLPMRKAIPRTGQYLSAGRCGPSNFARCASFYFFVVQGRSRSGKCQLRSRFSYAYLEIYSLKVEPLIAPLVGRIIVRLIQRVHLLKHLCVLIQRLQILHRR
jgi:hypothetical protein